MKNKLSIALIGLILLALATSACGIVTINVNGLRGSGHVTTETRAVSGFNRLVLGGAGTIDIIQDGSESLTVETDDNLQEYVRVEVRGDSLYVDLHPQPYQSLDVTRLHFSLHVKDLESLVVSGAWKVNAGSLEADALEISISGAGQVEIDTLAAEALIVNISGAGEVELAGQVISQTITISGLGECRNGDLRSETTEVHISGAGHARLWVSESLEVSVSGGGEVDYYGSPRLIVNRSCFADVDSLGAK